MSAESQTQIAAIFDQLLALRESVNRLQQTEAERVDSLRGHQTVDVDGAFLLIFQKLQGHIGSMEEALATIAEATGDIPKC
ncbi:hypothetical protein BFW88_18700 [Pseudomonas fluorescens]|uniref:Uncharacterized protein n=1 Tax=Pseudomonas lactucae TaxID=2813360 RepID=A0A9X1C838_9PSED|nr:hypothetical protein [Pseudomonas lactucae]OPA88021.1 hypothetical protein BFW88_18700 [Pseudomonas fluorescens]MBN2978740.1 hypothetical protein [Pseudomonas lactucae]MBN2986032.1 hypothetical protein [Pseudomonas lactucae]OPB08085.1 hypothetical protein BFW92_18655 [Pseudomonas fluorescens]OPB18859.1 hypothetical protein BFW93_18675 [Pseudomonas fluorescens]